METLAMVDMQKAGNQIWSSDLILLTLFLLGFYLLCPDSHPLFVPDEGRYSEIAREMLVTHDFITPRLDGVAFLDKPVLYYWLQASAIWLFGLKEWALRFWPAICGITGCIATCLSGQRFFSRRAGALSAIILATSPVYYGAAHYANLDLEMAVWISLTLFSVLLGLHGETTRTRTTLFLAAWVFAGFAFLTKGLIAIVFPFMITGSYLLLTGDWRAIRGLHLVAGPLIFTLITLPWYYLVQQANPEFLHYFFITQQVTRFLARASFNNQEPFWFYLPVVFAGCLPWSLFGTQALGQAFRGIRHKLRTDKGTKATLFLLLWLIIIFVFFSIPRSKTIGYIIPVFPALALLTGKYLDSQWENSLFKQKMSRLIIVFGIGAVVAMLSLSLYATKINTKSIKPLITALQPGTHAQTEIVSFYKYYQDLPFYLQKRITIVADWHANDIPQRDNWVRELWYGMPFQDTRNWLIGENTFWQRWYSQTPMLVFMDASRYPQFAEKAGASIRQSGKYMDVIWVANQVMQNKINA